MSCINHKKPKYKYQLNKNLLPKVPVYLSEHGFDFKDHNAWSMILCPFHADKNPSLSINLTHGGFICFACGVTGGGLVAFHMKFRGLGFIETCKELGAWEKTK